MAEYNSDRTGANIDATLDKVDVLVDSGNNVTADGLTVNGPVEVNRDYSFSQNNFHLKLGENSADSYIGNANGSIYTATGAYYGASQYQLTGGATALSGVYSDALGVSIFSESGLTADSLNTRKQRLFIEDNGDVSFYEDTGTTAKMVWSSSAEELQISSNLSVTLGSSDGSGTLPYLGFGSYWDGAKLRAQGSSYFGYALAGDRVGNKVSLQRYDSAGAVSGNITLAGNNVGIGTTSPSAKLDLNRPVTDGVIANFRKDGTTVGSIGSVIGQYLRIGTSNTGIMFQDGSSAIEPRTESTNNDASINIGATSNRFKDLYLSGGVITSSDYRLKEDIQPMQSYADTVKQMNLVNFAWKESGTREDGFIAHELQALVPSAVRGDKDAINEDGEAQHQGVDPLKLIPVLAKALQEALERIEILESK